jgi:LDH2 family malate/lactate/ureidoglycolate dehydrogenase
MFLAFDPEILMPRAEFAEALAELIASVRSTPPLDPSQPVRIPSERSFREREERRKTGIPLAPEVHRKLVELAAKERRV